ncbi:MAG: helix-turn-helix transcriptional regulator [Ignavibacteriaceae bacterium]|jgi:DNA-binding Xre family transcriptional regulator
MLTYNLKKHFKLRGITSPTRFLMEIGFTKQIAYNIARNNFTGLSPKHLEKLCLSLNCTPNDLMEWEPDKQIAQPEKFSLNKLRPAQFGDLWNFAKDVPYEKMGELIAQIEEAKKKINNQV